MYSTNNRVYILGIFRRKWVLLDDKDYTRKSDEFMSIEADPIMQRSILERNYSEMLLRTMCNNK